MNRNGFGYVIPKFRSVAFVHMNVIRAKGCNKWIVQVRARSSNNRIDAHTPTRKYKLIGMEERSERNRMNRFVDKTCVPNVPREGEVNVDNIWKLPLGIGTFPKLDINLTRKINIVEQKLNASIGLGLGQRLESWSNLKIRNTFLDAHIANASRNIDGNNTFRAINFQLDVTIKCVNIRVLKQRLSESI